MSINSMSPIPGSPPNYSHKPRICMPTTRNFNRRLFQCPLYEAQDVLLETDNVDMISLEPSKTFDRKWLWYNTIVTNDFTKRAALLNPGLKPIKLTKEYDIFVAVCQNWWDLLYINAIKGWKDYCKTSICWIDELWSKEIKRYEYWLPSLERFDHVMVGLEDSVNSLSNAIGRQCHYMPMAVDAIRFSPFPRPPNRVIDVYSIGRKLEGVHQTLLDYTAKKDFFYIYDSFAGSNTKTFDYRLHRELTANILKRSKYFIVFPAKFKQEDQTDGQLEVGNRFFEGCASGAVLLGVTPDCESFKALFDWHDSVINIHPDGSDLEYMISRLAAQPDRLREISRRNAMEALLRHDWVYRWAKIFNITGHKPASALEER